MIRYNYKSLLPTLAFAIACSVGSCTNDLDISPINPQISGSFNQDEIYAKVYATLSLTGQEGAAGNSDIAGTEEGTNTPFYRMILTLYEYPTDEVICSWSDPGIPALFQMGWGDSNLALEGFYARLMFDVTLCNHFLDETESLSDEKTLRQRAEVRFIRALNYYYLLDAFGNPPFVTSVSSETPPQIQQKDLFDFLETELLEMEPDLVDARAGLFGQVDKACVWMLLSRLYLNAEVYTGTPRWSDAISYADRVIVSGYDLCDTYSELFMADNDENTEAMQEIILPLRLDGAQSRSYGAAQFAIAATHTSGMTPWGTSEGWGGVRAREALVMKFFEQETEVPLQVDENEMAQQAGDDRALFFSGSENDARTLAIDDPYTFKQGLSIAKWTNIRSDGQPAHDATWVDTDVPFFRLAEAYLTKAEAILRNGGNAEEAREAINTLRRRAHADELSAPLTLDDILDEKAREFYFEGQRRTDLIRYGYFTSAQYLWDWKAGERNGKGISADYNLFPIPASDLNANSNLEQNKGY